MAIDGSTSKGMRKLQGWVMGVFVILVVVNGFTATYICPDLNGTLSMCPIFHAPSIKLEMNKWMSVCISKQIENVSVSLKMDK